MAILECAISGLKIKVEHCPAFISKDIGYYHPIFALEYKQLYGIYSKHCAGHLTNTDSYLLFLAFLNHSDKIKWNHPAKINPNSPRCIKLVENNLAQLIKVLETTFLIRHPKFKQPGFSVTEDNCSLQQIPNWIKAWQDNIATFNLGLASQRLQEDIIKLENKLSKLLLSALPPEQYIHAVAKWAAKAADFPKEYTEEWCKVIRACYNPTKIFNVSPTTLKEIHEYCLENIEQGSIHSHSLMSALKNGIKSNINYLGINVNPELGYTLVPYTKDKTTEELEIIKATAPLKEPNRADYTSNFEFIKAKLKYKVAQTSTDTDTTVSTVSTETKSFNITGKETKL